MPERPKPADSSLRRGVVAVVPREERLLVIRRSALVVAPGAYCFPGGNIETGESEDRALVRELREELGATARPVRRVWRSLTPWQVELAWWLAEVDPREPLVPNPAEVESIHWVTPSEMSALAGLLESNRRFLELLARGEILLGPDPCD